MKLRLLLAVILFGSGGLRAEEKPLRQVYPPLAAPAATRAQDLPGKPLPSYKPDQFDYKSAHEKSPKAQQRLRLFQMTEDEQSPSKNALTVTLDKQLVRTEPFPILTVPPIEKPGVGLYRVTVRMKMQGMLNSLGTGIIMEVHGANHRVIYLNEFDAENVYQDFTLDFEIREPDIVVCDTDGYMKMLRDRMQLTPEQDAAVVAALKEKPGQPFAPTAFAAVKLSEQQVGAMNSYGASTVSPSLSMAFEACTGFASGGTRGAASPQPSLRKLTIASVKFERLPETDIVVRSIEPHYAWRRPGEPQDFRISLHNRSGKDRKGQLRLTLRNGLDGVQVLGDKDVSMKNGGYQTVAWNWEVPKEHKWWGQEIEAAVVEDGKIVSTERSWFTVHPRVTAVMIPANTEAKTRERWRHPYTPKPWVANYDEFWAPTPYDSAGLVPEDPTKPFLRGNTESLGTIAGDAEHIRRNKDKGVFSAFYLEHSGTGLKAWDLFLDKPEQVIGYTAITDDFYLTRQNCVRQLAAGKMPGPRPEDLKLGPHVQFVEYNGLYKETVDRVINGTIELVRLTGFDGNRWDGSFPFQAFNQNILGKNYGKTDQELFDIGCANFKRFTQEVRAKAPNFEWRMNAGIGALMSKPDDPFDFAKARSIIEKDFHKVFMADNAGIQEEAWGFSYPGFADYKNICLNYIRACRYETAAYKYVGGHHAHMHNAPHPGGYYTPDCIYLQSFDLLGGVHVDSINYAPMPDSEMDLGVYAARFCEFFWDPQLKVLEKIGEKVRVKSEDEIWSSEAGFEKDTERGTHLYVLGLIRPPATERWLKNRFGLLPAPIRKPIGVTVRIPEGYKRAKTVYLLEGSPYPTVKTLATKEGNGEVSFEVPELMIFKAVAIEFEK